MPNSIIKSGMDKLDQVDLRLRKATINYASRPDAKPFTITCGPRSKVAQMDALKSGASKASFGESPHNYVSATGSLAEDILPVGANLKYDATDWNLVDDFKVIARGIIAEGKALGYEITWGADWDRDNKTRDEGDKDEKFVDLPHLQIASWRDEVKVGKAKLVK